MYDRKTWVVLALCGALLAANLYISSQNAVEEQKAKAQQEALQKTLAPPATAPAPAAATQTAPTETASPATAEELITLESSEVVFTLTNIGGGIKYAEFKKQFQVGDKASFVRVNRFGAGPIGALADSNQNPDNVAYAYNAEESIPNKKAVYTATLSSGMVATKTFSLVNSTADGSPYLLDFRLELKSGSGTIDTTPLSIFLGESSPLYQAEAVDQTGYFWRDTSELTFNAGTDFEGSWYGSSPKSLLLSDSEKNVDFAGVSNQFFTTVIKPKSPSLTQMWAKQTKVKIHDGSKMLNSVRAGLQLPALTIEANSSKTFDYLIFIGPKHNPLLRKMENHWGDGWGDVMQYGSWLQVVARPLNWLMNIYHNLLDGIAKNWSWGLAIILLTITVRIFIWPLHAKSTHTMKRMAKLQPEIAKLKEKYPDDPNKLNTEMMGLYRKFGINPLGGCLPMLIQIPIFFGFFKMLQYAVELRGQGFLWVDDLSQPDTLYTFQIPFELPLLGASIPFNILPIVMAITSFLQIQMTPKTGDPMQQRIIMFMPFIFFFFCYNFASALALYWTTQNIFSIGQTWLMSKVPEPELKARPVSDKKSFVQRMAERQAEMQRQKKSGGSSSMRDVSPDSSKKKRPRTGG